MSSSTKVVRKDIQALRAIAVGVVVIFHLWPERLSGGFVGVDVFFVISGYLITQHLLREAKSGTFSVLEFWSRRVRRLLPASIFVLLVTLAGIVLFAPRSIWPTWIAEVGASAAYFENWFLAASAVDYLAADNSPSPTQHFWSLSVEEQFYFVLPLLMLPLVLFLKGREFNRIRRAFVGLMGLIVATSLVAAVYLTFSEPAGSYFYTHVRAWQFAAGALLAAAVLNAPTSKVLRTFLASVGLLLIAGSALFLSGSMAYPGYWALIPTIGALLVLAAQLNHGWLGSLASFRPVQFLGDISYSLYLWHWPIIILFPLAIGAELGIATKLLVIVASVLLAYLSYRFIEQPFIRGGRKPNAKAINALAAMAIGCATIFFATSSIAVATTNSIRAELQSLADQIPRGSLPAPSGAGDPFAPPCFGAAANAPDGAECLPLEVESKLVPAADLAPQDDPRLILPSNCQTTNASDSIPKPCNLTDSVSPTKIALIGDSHSAQLVAPMTAIAKKNNWQVVSFSKGGCPFSLAQREHDVVLTNACKLWVQSAFEKLTSGNFDLVVTSQISGVTWAATSGLSERSYAEKGLRDIWEKLNAEGVPVLVLQDNPRPVKNSLTCIAKSKSDDFSNCVNPRASALLYDPQIAAVKSLASPKTQILDFTNVYCDSKVCDAVIGGVIVHRDTNHLTNTFARTLAPYIEVKIREMIIAN